jgi:serine protease SohB
VSQFFAAYGLFLAELATLALLVVVAVAIVVATRRGGHGEGLVVEHLNRTFEDAADELKLAMSGSKAERKREAKARAKERKREDKARARDAQQKPRTFVLDFRGDLRATAVASLREEVSAVLQVAQPGDDVLLKLENPGGTVHEHGLAASQLLRLKHRGLRLTIVVDKVAASGGYLMACVGDRLVAAPFAIIGSIGVVAQLPNFHRLLDQKGIDFEQITAGRFKRTLTMFGRNTDEGREKLREEVEDVHELFKAQIREYRPQVDLDRAATGEHWHGARALDLKLVDALGTSDDLLREAAKERDLYAVAFKRRRPWSERMWGGIDSLLERVG